MLDLALFKIFNLKFQLLLKKGDKPFQSKHCFISAAPEVRYEHEIARMYSQGLSLQIYTPKHVHVLAQPSAMRYEVNVFLL